MKKRYYISYRSDNYSCVVLFTSRYHAKVFTQKRNENMKTTPWITFDCYSKLLTKKEALSYWGHMKVYSDWRMAAKKLIPRTAY